VGLGVVPDSRPMPDRVRDAAGEFGIALGSQKSVVNIEASRDEGGAKS
jgi:hypothetical protein